MLARRLREQLEMQLDHSLGDFAGLFARHRAEIRRQLPELARRRRWFEQVLDGPVPVLLRSGQREAAGQAFEAALQDSHGTPAAGSVTLVGAGNGDPGLLTLKALRALNQADLLVCDAHVAPAVLALARRDADRVPMPIDVAQTLALLMGHANHGQRVVVLKPGDAFRMPPDDQLSRELVAQGVVCEVVAGVGL
jgi:hypothetical protein